jgi:hypothetical protein
VWARSEFPHQDSGRRVRDCWWGTEGRGISCCVLAVGEAGRKRKEPAEISPRESLVRLLLVLPRMPTPPPDWPSGMGDPDQDFLIPKETPKGFLGYPPAGVACGAAGGGQDSLA